MTNLKWTKTEQNLLKSFAWESQARTRYDYFASQAKKDWLEQISAIFTETALNEKEHAKRFFKFLEGGMVEITATYPAWKIGTTLDNLKASADWENEEWTDLYPSFAKVAREEWFEDIAVTYEKIAEVEKEHEKRYRKLYNNLENGKVFKKDLVVIWKCRNCWYIHESRVAPDECPACLHTQAYYELQSENY
jgi:rubrerythrin